jgi:hypothetical protein
MVCQLASSQNDHFLYEGRGRVSTYSDWRRSIVIDHAIFVVASSACTDVELLAIGTLDGELAVACKNKAMREARKTHSLPTSETIPLRAHLGIQTVVSLVSMM